MDHTHYDNLQVARNASDEVIKGAYKYLSQKWHPDRQPPDRRLEAERVMKLINTAYAVLIDPVARKKHDEWIREQEEAAGLFNGASRTNSTADAGTTASSGSSGGRSQLSDDVRGHFVETITSNAWPAFTIQALVGTFFWLFLFFLVAKWLGFLPALERFIEKYPWVYLIASSGLMWTGFSFAKGEKRKSLYNLSDDLLAIRFQETKSRKLIFIAVSIALLVGGMIAFAVWNRSDSAPSVASTGAANAPAAPSTGERVVPPFVRPAPAPAAAPAVATQKMRVINECHMPAAVLFAREAPSQFVITRISVMAASNEVFDLGAPLVEKRDAEAYWSARSVDRELEWVEKDVTKGAAFLIEEKSVRFFEATDRDSEGTYLVKILCSKPKLELIN